MGQPKVGVGVILVRSDDRQILVGKRLNSLGHGEWALPGGHLELGEEWAECAARELREETGIEIHPSEFSFAHVVNCVWKSSDQDACTSHFVTIFMLAIVPSTTEAQCLEPHKCEGWSWHDFANLPKPLFAPLTKLINSGWNVPSQ